MRCLSRWLLAVGVAALIAVPAMTQQRGGRGGFQMGPAQLVNMEPVQKELKLSEEQVTKAKETLQTINGKYSEERAKLADLEGQERFTKAAEINAKQNEEIYTALSTSWKPEQVKRLKQIGVQAQGLRAFMSPSVDKVLKLTDEQKEKVRTFTSEMGEEMRGLRGGGGGDPAEMMKKMTAMQKEYTAKGVAILTDDQKKEWKELTGNPFEIPMMGGGRGGRGGKGQRKKDKDKDF